MAIKRQMAPHWKVNLEKLGKEIKIRLTLKYEPENIATATILKYSVSS